MPEGDEVNIHHDIKRFDTMQDAVSFAQALPGNPKRRYYPLRSGYLDGWLIEWRRSDGGVRVMCADGKWHYIWSDACGPKCQ